LIDPDAEAVFFASCLGGMFGPEDGTDGATSAVIHLCERAGVRIRTPDRLDGLCCGTPWKSKGMTRGWDRMRRRTVAALITATEGGRLPVVVDASSCDEGITSLLAGPAGGEPGPPLRVLDAVEFAATVLMPKLTIRNRLTSIALHPTCAAIRAGTSKQALESIAGQIADEVFQPVDAGCCAFAGDRGLLHPELTASATRAESADLAAAEQRRGRPFDAYVSSNRTCEIALTRATGRRYRHILEILAGITA